MSDAQTPKGALADVRVLDLSRVLAGPWAGQLLADLGADVVKVERPGQGDDTRGWGPPFVAEPDGARGDASYYYCANRNKRAIAVDVSRAQGAEIVARLAADADVVIENFKTGGLAKYGLDYAALAKRNRALVYCSITGFGQTGPRAHEPGYDFLIQAAGGLMSVTGQPDGAPGAEPMKTGVAVADLFTGLYAASAILAALHHAQRTGEGQHLDIALYDCQLAMLANQASGYFATGAAPGRLGNAHPSIAPYQVFATADGHIVVAVGNDAQFARLCALLEVPGLADDPRFATNAARVAGREILAAKLGARLADRTSADWLAALRAAAVPCGPINSVAQAFEDVQAQARDMAWSLARADGTRATAAACPVKMSATPPSARRAPPAHGADTDAVLAERLGLDAAALSKLRADGVVG